MSVVEQGLPVGTWGVDKVHSRVGFAVKYLLVGTFRGEFAAFDINLEVGADGAQHLKGAVESASVVVKDESLAGHLRAPDFFDSELHPQITFASDELRREGERVVVPGTLTIKGISHQVEATGTVADESVDPWGNTRLGLSFTAVIDRTAFGLTWNNPLPNGDLALANDVTLEADLQLVKAA